METNYPVSEQELQAFQQSRKFNALFKDLIFQRWNLTRIRGWKCTTSHDIERHLDFINITLWQLEETDPARFSLEVAILPPL